MAQVWFGDLSPGFCGVGYPNPVWKQELENDSVKFKIFVNDLNLLYNNWAEKFGEDFKPIIIKDNKIVFNNTLLLKWKEHKTVQSFCFQGGLWKEQSISWGRDICLSVDEEVQIFTKELLSLMSDVATIRFDFQAIADDGYEDYSIIISYNKEDDSIKVDYDASFETEETCEACDGSGLDEEENECEDCDGYGTC